jgi:hypothetical protein
VLRFHILRDGGTTNIEYKLNDKQGTIHIPNPLAGNELFRTPTNTYDGKTTHLENLLK